MATRLDAVFTSSLDKILCKSTLKDGHFHQDKSTELNAMGISLSSVNGSDLFVLKSNTEVDQYDADLNVKGSWSSGVEKATCVCYNSSTNELWIGDKNGAIHVMTIAGDKLELKEKKDAHVKAVTCIKSSHDGKKIMSANGERYIHLWNAETGAQEKSFTQHKDGVVDVSFSPDGTKGLAVSNDRTFSYFAIDESSNPNRIMEPHEAKLCRKGVVANNGQIFTLGDDDCIRIW